MLNPVITPEVALMIKRGECTTGCQSCQHQCEQAAPEALLSWQDRQSVHEDELEFYAEYGQPKRGEKLLRKHGYLTIHDEPVTRDEELIDIINFDTLGPQVVTRPIARKLFDAYINRLG
jgi:hypothetical protein